MARLKAVVGTMTQQRVAFCGPLGVGKTTAVRAISDVEVANTDVLRTAVSRRGVGSRSDKSMTTVGIDYGEWHRSDGNKIAVYGTPGQVRFDSVRTAAVGSSSLAVVLWLFGHNAYALDEADEWMRYVGVSDPNVYARLSVAVTRVDEPGDHPTLDDHRPMIAQYGANIPVLQADPRARADVERVVHAALASHATTQAASA